MRIVLLLLVLCAIPAEAQQVPAQFSITVQNPSFEAPMAMAETFDCQHDLFGGYQPGSFHAGRVIPGWTNLGNAGVAQWSCLPQSQYRVGNPLDDSAYLPPDGQNVAFLGDHFTIFQDLGVPLQGGTYLLKFYIANWLYSYPGKLRASILVGQHELCHSETWALGAWTQVSLTCDVPGYLTYNGFGWSDFGSGNVGIAFAHSAGWIVMLDEVSMWFTAPAFAHN